MVLQHPPRSLYAAFDRFPSPKGAATHIGWMATTLFETTGHGLLYVLGGEGLPFYQFEEGIEILRFEESIPNFLERTIAFGASLADVLERYGESLEICHFRDPWSGTPILELPNRHYKTVYEVNGLPSIELPYTYPHLSRATLAKIRLAEERCWSLADAILTPSVTIADNLVRLGAPSRRITVVPNGAELPEIIPPPPADAPERYILYFGALQRWQGIDVLLRAFALLADIDDLHLVVCASTRHRFGKFYRKLAERLGVAERIHWRYSLPKRELAGWIGGAILTVAPLVECSRNLEQGCAPLKILESMAAAIPVVASDLPAVRELITNNVNGRLVRPDRPSELARAIRLLLEYPTELARLGQAGRDRIANDLTWERSVMLLRDLYAKVGVGELLR